VFIPAASIDLLYQTRAAAEDKPRQLFEQALACEFCRGLKPRARNILCAKQRA